MRISWITLILVICFSFAMCITVSDTADARKKTFWELHNRRHTEQSRQQSKYWVFRGYNSSKCNYNKDCNNSEKDFWERRREHIKRSNTIYNVGRWEDIKNKSDKNKYRSNGITEIDPKDENSGNEELLDSID